MKTPIPTTFSVMLNMTHRDGRPGCGYVAAGKSLAEALSDAFHMACFYLATGPGREGYGAVRVRIFEYCAKCESVGVIYSPRRRKCPVCKGRDGVRERLIVETTYKPYDNDRDDYVMLVMHDRAREVVS